jgi:hypothetical protein
MERGGHGLPKVSLRSAMLDIFAPRNGCKAFPGVACPQGGGLRPSSSRLDTPCRTRLGGRDMSRLVSNLLCHAPLERASHVTRRVRLRRRHMSGEVTRLKAR